MANEKTPVVWDDATKKHRPLGTGEKMGGLDASSMLSSDAGNLITSGSDGLAYLSGSGMVDPRADNLLEESDQGKLQVTVDRIAEWLDGHPQDAAALADAMNVVSTDAGNIIVQGTDKGAYLSTAQLASAIAGLTDAQKEALAQALAQKLAAQLADGKTIVAADGKLTSDPTNATAAQKAAINAALADADSGLVVDEATGMLQVDFSQMPTDKFEKLLKGLKMQVPLDRNLQLYVAQSDPAASDELDGGRGTEAKPFKTIQACVNHATSTYALGLHNISIRVKSGIYVESISLPRFDASGGCISISSYSGSHDVVIAPAVNSNGITPTCIGASGAARWQLFNLVLRHVSVPGETSGYSAVSLVYASDGARVDLDGIAFEQSAANGDFTGGSCDVRMVSADGGEIWFYHGALAHSFTFSNAPASFSVLPFVAMRGGAIVMMRSNAGQHGIVCNGSCNVFASSSDGSNFHSYGVGSRFAFSGTVTGKRYEVASGSYINCTGNNASYFPGDVAGTVESATYCWYN